MLRLAIPEGVIEDVDSEPEETAVKVMAAFESGDIDMLPH